MARAEHASPVDSAEAALAFVAKHGIVRFAGRGPGPSLVDAIAGDAIAGSWWGHRAGQRIFRIANDLAESRDILWCRLLGGKRTLIHRRLWPAIARLAGELPPDWIASVRQEHTATGAHRSVVEPFSKWAARELPEGEGQLTREEALTMMPADVLGK